MKRTALIRRTPFRKRKKSKLDKKKDNPRSTYWKRMADSEWAKYVHRNKKCAVCEKTVDEVKLEAHHIISRAVVHMRHDPDNGIVLCSRHHKHDPHCSPHAGPLGFSKVLAHILGEFKVAELQKRAYNTARPDYKARYDELRVLNLAHNESSTVPLAGSAGRASAEGGGR